VYLLSTTSLKQEVLQDNEAPEEEQISETDEQARVFSCILNKVLLTEIIINW
jgi:hypothetical protein